MKILQPLFASVCLVAVSGCQTMSTEEACRARAAASGVQLDGPAVVQTVPGTEQVIYGWEPVHNGRSGVQCTTQRGHVQDVTIFGWNT
ncbi:hypothetical protein GCM10009116_07070 [Brevundimonas basaltis]|uniref:Lipoprotein n=1 Tax=Brevundimonas basaltis TaxID=472166 RepID=A0A7W8HYR8_9CAUL|nr:hypothetical protein [Brevundimonas basaltis]MBB5292368.1 hypothetical protein [Brevundimonas basaltis]